VALGCSTWPRGIVAHDAGEGRGELGDQGDITLTDIAMEALDAA